MRRMIGLPRSYHKKRTRIGGPVMRLHRSLITGAVLALALAGCTFPGMGTRVYEPGGVYGGYPGGGGWGTTGGGWGNSGSYEGTRNACVNEAANRDFRVG